MIEQNDCVLDQEEIDKQLSKFPNVMDITKVDLEQLELNVMENNMIKKEYDALGAVLQSTVNNLHNELKKSEASLRSLDYINQKIYTEILENTKLILELQSNSQIKLKEIEKYYYNLVSCN